MSTLFQATLELANTLAILRTSTVTSTTDTVSTKDTKRTETDDAFNGGTLWVITDAGGDSDAPEGEWARVTDFANTGGDITHSALTAATNTGDTYGIATGDFPLDVLISAINNELKKQKVVRYDRTSLDIISGQSEYTLPAGIRQDNLLNVYEETDSDTSDSQPTPLNFKVQTAAAGSQHLLVIKSRNVTPGYDIMLEYSTFLSPLYLASDTIDASFPLARYLDSAAAHARAIKMSTFGSGSKLEIALMDIHRQDAILARAENPIRLPCKRGNINESAGD